MKILAVRFMRKIIYDGACDREVGFLSQMVKPFNDMAVLQCAIACRYKGYQAL